MAAFACWLLAAALPAAAASPSPAEPSVMGEITAVDSATRQLTLKTDSGATEHLSVPEDAKVVRVKPGATSLNDAAPAALGEAATGDRALARGARNDDGSFRVRRLVLMSGSEVAKQRQSEADDWRRRGVHGTVNAVDAASGRVTVRLGRSADAPTLAITTSDPPAVIRRYAPGSVKFSEARSATLAEIQKGDEVRAIGNRSADGSTLPAEQLVFGTFRMVTGRIVSIDAARDQLVVRDDDARQEIAVAARPDSRLRRLPPEIAARLAMRGARSPGEDGAGRPRMEARVSPEELLERMPAVALADLKAGDRILVSGAPGAGSEPWHVAVLVSGLEALAAAPTGPSGPRRGGRGVDVGLPPELMDVGMSLQ